MPTDVAIALIAVAGTVVGAISGLAGSVLGVRLQAKSNFELKKEELESARSQVFLQEALRWTEKAYGDLRTLLLESRKLGTSITQYDDYEDVIVELQAIDTSADLLVANPLIAGDVELVQSIRSYVSTMSVSLFDDWSAAKQGRTSKVEGTPVGVQGNNLARAVGATLVRVMAESGWKAPASP